MAETTKGKVAPKGKGILDRVLKRTPKEAAKANRKAREKDPGALFWLPARLDGPDQQPMMIEEPFPDKGIPGHAQYPRILRKGKPFEIKGQVFLGALKGDRAIAIYLITKDPRVRYDRDEVIKKGVLTEKDFEMIDKGKHPDHDKDKPNETPVMCLPDIDLLTNAEAIDFCKAREINLPAGADSLAVKAHIKKVLGLKAPATIR